MILRLTVQYKYISLKNEYVNTYLQWLLSSLVKVYD